MEYFLQQLINGITLGSIYGLIAIGYTMVYGIIGMINFAHGDVFMVGGFVSLIAHRGLGNHRWQWLFPHYSGAGSGRLHRHDHCFGL